MKTLGAIGIAASMLLIFAALIASLIFNERIISYLFFIFGSINLLYNLFMYNPDKRRKE